MLTSRYIGQGRPEWTGGVLRGGLVYAGWIGAASAASLILLGPGTLHAFRLAPAWRGGYPSLYIFLLSWDLSDRRSGDALPSKPWVRRAGLAFMWAANAVKRGDGPVAGARGLGVEAQGRSGAAWGNPAAGHFWPWVC